MLVLSLKKLPRLMKHLVSRASVISMISKTALWVGLQIEVNLDEMLARLCFLMMKMNTTILDNQIKELSQTVEVSMSNSSLTNGNKRERRVSFGTMQKKGVKNSSNSKPGMSLTIFSTSSNPQMNKA